MISVEAVTLTFLSRRCNTAKQLSLNFGLLCAVIAVAWDTERLSKYTLYIYTHKSLDELRQNRNSIIVKQKMCATHTHTHS